MTEIRRSDGSGGALAGGLFGTFQLPKDLAFVVARGSGVILEATDGTTYLDHVLGSGPLVLGHAHPRVVEAIESQARRGTTFYALNEPGLELADRIAALVPCAESVKLVTSGSEAVFYALRIARATTGRTKVLKFEGAYHGHNDYSLHSLQPGGDDPQRPDAVPASAGIPTAVSEGVIVAPYNDIVSVEKLLEEHGADIAAVIVEPVQRSIEPLPGFLDALRRACDRIGALLVFDEVVTGFRLSLGGAQEIYGVTPDLCSLGKVIGGGLALAALAGRRELLEVTIPGNATGQHVYLSGTLNGNPLAAAAGLATLDVLAEDDGCGRIAMIGEQVGAGLLALARELSCPVSIIGPSAFPQPVFGATDPVTDARALQRTNMAAARAFGLELIKRGVFVHPGQKLYIATAHGSESLERFLSAARGALQAVRDAGLLEAA